MGLACTVMLLIVLLSGVQVRYMSIYSFYYKTNIVILTCTSDIFPPVLPSLSLVSNVEELSGKGLGPPVGGCQAYITTSKH